MQCHVHTALYMNGRMHFVPAKRAELTGWMDHVPISGLAILLHYNQ